MGVAGEVPDDVLLPPDDRGERLRAVRVDAEVVGRPGRRVDVPDLVVTEDEDRSRRRGRGLLQPGELIARDPAAGGGRAHGVEHGERRATDLDRVRRALERERRVEHRVVVAAHVVEPVAEAGVGVEERVVLLLAADAGEVALGDHGVRTERIDLPDRGLVHRDRVRRLARPRPHPGTEHLLGRVVDHPADGLAEVDVVHRRDRGEVRAGGRRERAHRRGHQLVGIHALDRERVRGVRLQADDLHHVERARRRHDRLADRGLDRHVGLGHERDRDRIGTDGRDLRGPDLAHRATLMYGPGRPSAPPGANRLASSPPGGRAAGPQ